MTRKVFTIGGGSKGATIKHNIVKKFELYAEDIIGVDVITNS